MDAAKADLVAVCAGLSRLQLRLLSEYHASRLPSYNRTLRDVQPPSRWLDAADSNSSLGGAIGRVALAQAHLLAMVDSPKPVDARSALLALQHIQCNSTQWGGITRRLAKRWGYTLAESPQVEGNWSTLGMLGLPRPRRGSHARQQGTS